MQNLPWQFDMLFYQFLFLGSMCLWSIELPNFMQNIRIKTIKVDEKHGVDNY
jgi:hypothetical protein